MISVHCPHCNNELRLPREKLGKKLKCAYCGQSCRFSPDLATGRVKNPPRSTRKKEDLSILDEHRHLGSHVQTFRPKRGKKSSRDKPITRQSMIGCSSAVLAIGVLILALTIVLSWHKLVILPSLILIGLGIFVLIAALTDDKDVNYGLSTLKRILVCEKGFLCEGADEELAFRWESFVKIENAVFGCDESWDEHPTFRTVDGNLFEVDPSFGNLDSFYKLLYEKVSDTHMKIAEDKLENGSMVHFGGCIEISKKGLRLNERRYAWQQIDRIELGFRARGEFDEYDTHLPLFFIFLTGDEEPLYTDQRNIDNLPILISLIRRRYPLPIIEAN